MLLVAVNKKFTVTTCACFHPQDQCARAMMGGPPQAMVQGGLPQATVQPVAMVPMQVVVPPDAQGGGQMIMGTPSGPMQVIVPVGLNPGDQFVAQVPSSMPVANTSAVMPVAPVAPMPPPSVDVPARVALGEIVLSRDAEAYCASLPRQPATEYGGCRRIKCPAGGACGWCSCCVAYSYAMPMNEDCLCFPFTCVLFPLPFFNLFPWIALCSDERRQNRWIHRDEHGDQQCAWVIVDAEKKTDAWYFNTCGPGDELASKPACYCVK